MRRVAVAFLALALLLIPIVGSAEVMVWPSRTQFGANATVYAGKFTTTGTGTGTLTFASGETITVASGANLVFRTPAVADNAQYDFSSLLANSSTTGNHGFMKLSNAIFSPAAGSANYAALHILPQVNASGAQTGLGYGLGIALVNTNLNGLTWKFIDVGTTTSTLFSGYTSLFNVDINGYVTLRRLVTTRVGAPTLTSCGTGTITATSTDLAGDVTATGATACTVNFQTAYTNQPVCVIEEITTLATHRISSISTSAFTVTGLTSGDRFLYICIGA